MNDSGLQRSVFDLSAATRRTDDFDDKWHRPRDKGILSSRVWERLDLPELARLRMEELASSGLSDTDHTLGVMPKQADPYKADKESKEGEQRPLRMSNGQVFWLHLDTRAAARALLNGEGMKVSGNPVRTDRAIVAALVASEGRRLKIELIERAVERIPPFLEKLREERAAQRTEKEPNHHTQLQDSDDPLRTFVDAFGPFHDAAKEVPVKLSDLSMKEPLEFVMAMTRHYFPDFDNLPLKEQVGLIEKACGYINAFLEALQDLTNFFEYGTSEGLKNSTFKDIDKKLKASLLKDVYGLNSHQIGEELSIRPTPSDKGKQENQNARKMAHEGKGLWEQAFGKEGWQERVEVMRAERERWKKLSVKDQYIELLAEDAEISVDDTRRIVEEVGFGITLDELNRAYEQGDKRRALQIKLSDARYNRPLDDWE